MICQICQKKTATIHFTEIEDDKVVKMHLCEDCAEEKGFGENPSCGLGNLVGSLSELGDKEEDTVHCPQCGLTFREFRKVGRLGCGLCYETFSEKLSPLIKTLHKGHRHVGKVPTTHPPKEETPDLDLLRKELRAAVEKEEFEKAAELRDRIKEEERTSSPPASKNPRGKSG